MTDETRRQLVEMYREGGISVAALSKNLGVYEGAAYRVLRKAGVARGLAWRNWRQPNEK